MMNPAQAFYERVMDTYSNRLMACGGKLDMPLDDYIRLNTKIYQIDLHTTKEPDDNIVLNYLRQQGAKTVRDAYRLIREGIDETLVKDWSTHLTLMSPDLAEQLSYFYRESEDILSRHKAWLKSYKT